MGIKEAKKKERLFLYGFGFYLILYGISVVFEYFRAFYVNGTYTGHLYIGDLEDVSIMYEVLRLGSYISSFLGFLLFFLYFEKAFKNTKYIPALISLSTIVTIVFFIDINEILTYINVIIVILILYWFYKNSSKEFQIITIFFYLGMIVIIIGGLFNWRRFREIYAIPPTYGYFVTILGVIMITIPLLIEPEKFTRSKILKPVNVWILILIIVSILLPFSINTLINTDVSSQFDAFIMIFSAIFVCIILIMISLRNIRKHMKKDEIPKTKADSPDLMKIFTKPQKLTEEEVSISKEKKVCLVCKGGVTRYDIYICPECNALYHQKCAKTLEGLENACWACETPFNESKPVKLDKKEEEKEIEIESELHKSKKNI